MEVSLNVIDVLFLVFTVENVQSRSENPKARRLGFPNVIMPGEIRNDLYLTLDRGNFDRGGKTASRNVEVSLIVIDQTGKIVDNCIYYSACNGYGQSRATLPILYHNNSPIWNETLRLQVCKGEYLKIFMAKW